MLGLACYELLSYDAEFIGGSLYSPFINPRYGVAHFSCICGDNYYAFPIFLWEYNLSYKFLIDLSLEGDN